MRTLQTISTRQADHVDDTASPATSNPARKHVLLSLIGWIVLLVILVGLHSLAWVLAVRSGIVTAEENGGMENVQALTCLLAAIIFCRAALLRSHTERIFHVGLALLCFSFFMREMDVEDLAVPAFVEWILRPLNRNTLTAICWLALGAVAIRHIRTLFTMSLQWMRSPSGWLLLTAGAFLIVSSVFDAHLLPMPKSTQRVWEEVIESDGFLLLVICAVLCARTQTGFATKTPPHRVLP